MPEMSRIYALKQILIRTMRLAFLYPRNALHFVVSFDYGIVSLWSYAAAAALRHISKNLLIASRRLMSPRIFSAARSIWTKISSELR